MKLRDNKSSYTICRHKFIALLEELKVSPLNMPDDSEFHRRPAAGRSDRLNWSVQQCGFTKANSPRTAEVLVLRAANKIIQMLNHRVVHSVINLIEQNRGTDLSSVPQTTTLTFTQTFGTANNSIQQTQIHTGAKYWKLDKTYLFKQLLSTRGQSNNFPRHTDS